MEPSPIKKEPIILNYLFSDSYTKEVPVMPTLTTEKAVQLLLSDGLRDAVCRYCLKVTPLLTDVEEVLQIAKKRALYKVAIKDMIASFYPYQITMEEYLPNKICENCIDRTLSAYLFAQQCEQTQRALNNCLMEVINHVNKLDPIEQTKKRGRRKKHFNHNIIHASHKTVLEYADPIIQLVNRGSQAMEINKKTEISNLECPKCWQVLPSIELLMNHEKIHPTTMWYNCSFCGLSHAKLNHLKKHIRASHRTNKPETPKPSITFVCENCNTISENHLEHIKHMEKHKFKSVLENLIMKKSEMCVVCLERKDQFTSFDKPISFHGGYPELIGDKSIYTILCSTFPEMITMDCYTGKKICENCLNLAINSYIFVNQTRNIRKRVNNLFTLVLDKLCISNEFHNNIFIELSDDWLLPITEDQIAHEKLMKCFDEILDESKLPIEVLEDQYRIESSDSEVEKIKLEGILANDVKDGKLKSEKKLMNGFLPSKVTKKEHDLKIQDGFKLTTKNYSKSKKLVKFTCPICNKHYLSDYCLKKHVLNHVNRKACCATCKISFKTKFFFMEHVRMTHKQFNGSFYTCSVCGRAFDRKYKFESHKATHSQKICFLCEKCFSSQKHFDSHLQRHVRKLSASMKKDWINCSFCEKGFLNENELAVHVNKSHLQIKPYGCNMCNRHFYTESNMRSHKKIHRLKSKEKCQICFNTFDCRRDLFVHIRKHLNSEPFS